MIDPSALPKVSEGSIISLAFHFPILITAPCLLSPITYSTLLLSFLLAKVVFIPHATYTRALLSNYIQALYHRIGSKQMKQMRDTVRDTDQRLDEAGLGDDATVIDLPQ